MKPTPIFKNKLKFKPLSKSQKKWRDDIEKEFIKRINTNTVDLAPEFSKVVDDNFWELV